MTSRQGALPIIFRVTVIALIAQWFAGSAAASSDYAVYLDASGSMRGFQASGVWSAMLDDIEAGVGAGRKRRFGAEPSNPRGSLSQEPLNESQTNLASALEDWLATSRPGEAVVFVTDNVADERDTDPSTPQKRFYQILQERNGITHISLIPTQLPFSGRVFEPGNDTNNAQYPPRRAETADRALALYLLVRDAPDNARISALENRLKGILAKHGVPHDLLRIAPFGIEGWEGSVRTDVRLAGDSPAAGVRATMDPDWGLLIRGLPLGAPQRLSFDVEIQPGPNFLLKDAEVEAVIRLESGEFLASGQFVGARITPDNADLEPEMLQRFNVDFDIAAIDFFGDVPMATKLRLAFSGTTVVRGQIAIRYAVRREKVFLVGPAAEQWSYTVPVANLAKPDPKIQTRIYRLADLVRGMVPEEQLSRDVLTNDVWIELVYPAGPVMVAAVGGLIPLLLLIWLMHRFLRPAHYTVREFSGDGQPISPGFLSASSATVADGACRVSVRRLGIGLWVSSNARLIGMPFLPPSGGTVRLVPRDTDMGGPLTVRIEAPRRRGRNMPHLDD